MSARELQPCGTVAAYTRHYRHGEEPCAPCRHAKYKQMRAYQQRTGHGRARQRALRALRRRYPEVYAALRAEQEAAEPDARTSKVVRERVIQRALRALAKLHDTEFEALMEHELAKETTR